MHYVGVAIACVGSFVYNNISEEYFTHVKRKVHYELFVIY